MQDAFRHEKTDRHIFKEMGELGLLGTADSEKVMAYLKSTKLKDFYAEGYVRADERYVHNMYLIQVKTPAESHEPRDYLKVAATIARR